MTQTGRRIERRSPGLLGSFRVSVTIEDEALPPMGERLHEAVDLARKLSLYGGCYVVLIHPNTLGHKLAFERGFVDAVREFSCFRTLSEFGQWWSARNKVGVDVDGEAERWTVHLDIPEPMAGLTLSRTSATRHPLAQVQVAADLPP